MNALSTFFSNPYWDYGLLPSVFRPVGKRKRTVRQRRYNAELLREANVSL